MRWHGSASGKRGRTPMYSDVAVQFCLTVEGLFNLPLHQAMGLAQSLLELADWLGKCPNSVPSAGGRSILR